MRPLISQRTQPGIFPLNGGNAELHVGTEPTPTMHIIEGATRVDPKVTAHYHASAELYRHWSPEGHLHFGYWRWPLNPFNRRALLEELVHQVVHKLDPTPGMRLADLGCGYGAAARLVAQHHGCHVAGITVVEEQVVEGTVAALAQGLTDKVTMLHRDFRETGLASNSIDGVYALESLCYGDGTGKQDVLDEAYRILKPGGRIALTDGFLVKVPKGIRARMVRTTAEGWAMSGFAQRDAFVDAMAQAGFTDIVVRDKGWRMGVCALHGPLLMLRLALQHWITGRKRTPLERAHLRSCLLGIALGTQPDLFRYLMITACKRHRPAPAGPRP